MKTTPQLLNSEASSKGAPSNLPPLGEASNLLEKELVAGVEASPSGGRLEGAPIGILGGTFNPIHYGHIRLAKRLLKEVHLQEIWMMVSPQNPFKTNQELLDDNLRLEMVRQALAKETRLIACDYEFHLPKPSYTWHTLQALSKDYPQNKFVLIIGSDNWNQFKKWFAYEKILANYQIVVYPRRGDQINASSLPPNVSLLKHRLINISSTEVRRRVRTGEPIDKLVPPAVKEMIDSHQLYL